MKRQVSIPSETMAQATCGHDVPCGDIVASLAALSGVELANPTGYLDTGTTDILRTTGVVRDNDCLAGGTRKPEFRSIGMGHANTAPIFVNTTSASPSAASAPPT